MHDVTSLDLLHVNKTHSMCVTESSKSIPPSLFFYSCLFIQAVMNFTSYAHHVEHKNKICLKKKTSIDCKIEQFSFPCANKTVEQGYM